MFSNRGLLSSLLAELTVVLSPYSNINGYVLPYWTVTFTHSHFNQDKAKIVLLTFVFIIFFLTLLTKQRKRRGNIKMNSVQEKE